jgi:hypothetical protein
MTELNYLVFVLGYDLLHDVLDGIECDIAYDFCVELCEDFANSIYNNLNFSGYQCLSNYVNAHMDDIKARLEELR